LEASKAFASRSQSAPPVGKSPSLRAGSPVSSSPPSTSSKTLPQPEFAADLAPTDRERVRRQLGLLAEARGRLPQDPFPHYLAHYRFRRRGAVTDVLLTSG